MVGQAAEFVQGARVIGGRQMPLSVEEKGGRSGPQTNLSQLSEPVHRQRQLDITVQSYTINTILVGGHGYRVRLQNAGLGLKHGRTEGPKADSCVETL